MIVESGMVPMRTTANYQNGDCLAMGVSEEQ
jgi:hypothetical protein